MRIGVLNPNTTVALTELLFESGKTVCAPGTTLFPLTAPRGVPYIASRAEAQIGGAIALEMIAENQDKFDAFIIAAFGDPGLMAARELFDVPVIGMAEAAMLAACMLGQRFSIVTFARALGPWYQECVNMHGLAGRCAGIAMLDESFSSISDVQAEKEEALVALANEAIATHECDVAILAGAPLAGLAPLVRDRIAVPVIDQIGAAVKMAEAVVSLNPRKANAGSFRRPPAKSTIGLPPALARRISHQD